ncbi:MAG: hypothetical protein EPO11_03200 [Gammaproteobacteria bacterium]|nr:MAG: hypothetical protein EPO11_03200 [Gammaproteobacteria bacterium]
MKNWLILFMLVPVLAGCEKKNTYTYLTQHPVVLKQEVDRCQSTEEKTPDEMKQCEMVTKAADYVMSLMQEEEMDPQKFGQKIMDTQTACLKAEERCEEVKVLYGIAALNTPE